jgi:rhamnosyl/mannosyltransferase
MEQARRLGLNNVTFAGQVSDRQKAGLLSLCRAVVFPSFMRSEAFGVTLLEGAIHGKPLVSAEIGSGTSHVNDNGITGFVVEPGSATALRQALDALAADPELCATMGRNARVRYETLFTGRKMGDRYADLYYRLAPSVESQEMQHVPGVR